MKYIYIVIMIVSSLALSAQSIPIQLMVVDQNGFEMPNTQVKLRLTMRGDTSLTMGQYQEVHNVSTNDLGVVSVDLGEGIVTTNSQVLAIDLFSFGLDEPYIKTELDTSISPASYTNLGWMRYRYPLVARRALSADSAKFSDSASYLINENSDWFSDSSESNELQYLSYQPDLQLLSISDGNSVEIVTKNEYFGSSGSLLNLTNKDNGTSLPNYRAATKTHLYGFLDNILFKAPLNDPWDIDTVTFSFKIFHIFPLDSLVFGYLDANKSEIRVSDLSNTYIKSKGLPNSYWSNLDVAYRNNILSIYSSVSSYTRYLRAWDLDADSLYSLGLYTDQYFTANASYRKGNDLTIYDRFTGQFVSNILSSSNYYSLYNVQIDSTMTKMSYNSSTSSYYRGRSLIDTASSHGGISFGLKTSQSSTYYLNNPLGIELLFNSKDPSSSNSYADVTSYSYYVILNPNNINTDKSVTEIYLRDYDRSHVEVQGSTPMTILGDGEYLLFFRNAKNLFIEGNYYSGDFIYRIPFNQ